MEQKLRVAYLSPVNPVQSGISDYSEELIPALSRYAEIELYLDNDLKPSNETLKSSYKTYPAKRFKSQAGNYQAGLFHMGNSAAHTYIYQALLESKGQGILVLHDFVLHHFLIGYYLNRGRTQDYIHEMGHRYGPEGENVAREVIKGKLPEALFRYPLCDEAIEAAGAVLVHSQYARNLILSRHPGKKVGIARMGVPLPPFVSKEDARKRLGLPLNEFILTSLGHLNPYKRLDSALWAFKSFNRDYPFSRFILVGSPSPNYDVKAMVRALGLERKVEITGYTTGEKYADYLAASDVCVNLRYPTAGETSASLLRIMGAGRPVLVSRTGSFEELPDDTCIKVDVDDAEEELLYEYFKLLAREPEFATQIGNNARRYVAQKGRLEDAAYDYYVFLCEVLNLKPEIEPLPFVPVKETGLPQTPEPAPEIQGTIPTTYPAIIDTGSIENSVKNDVLLDEIAQAIAELGLPEASPSLKKVAEALEGL